MSSGRGASVSSAIRVLGIGLCVALASGALAERHGSDFDRWRERERPAPGRLNCKLLDEAPEPDAIVTGRHLPLDDLKRRFLQACADAAGDLSTMTPTALADRMIDIDFATAFERQRRRGIDAALAQVRKADVDLALAATSFPFLPTEKKAVQRVHDDLLRSLPVGLPDGTFFALRALESGELTQLDYRGLVDRIREKALRTEPFYPYFLARVFQDMEDDPAGETRQSRATESALASDAKLRAQFDLYRADWRMRRSFEAIREASDDARNTLRVTAKRFQSVVPFEALLSPKTTIAMGLAIGLRETETGYRVEEITALEGVPKRGTHGMPVNYYVFRASDSHGKRDKLARASLDPWLVDPTPTQAKYLDCRRP